MTEKYLSTDSYKGVRDFYPEDMAIQRYIFSTWAKTAERYGFERYDASILEPSALYKAKGAENEEMVNEQTYTFIDRGDREVTLRPEMTPSVARMVAGQRHELSFPLRWYSIPNLFRYERPQRGRLREHCQLNCDIFGASHYTADVELISLAYQTLIDFGAKPDMFEIRVNSRKLMQEQISDKLISPDLLPDYLRLVDKKAKISNDEFIKEEKKLIKDGASVAIVINDKVSQVLQGLISLGIQNAKFDSTITRGFNYYTDTVFEVFDVSGENNRAMLGGGRYDNLTEMFGGEAISGIGFGMGDVTMRDFLETHKLIPEYIRSTAPHVIVIPMTEEENMPAELIAQHIRKAGITVSTDIGIRKVGKKIGDASTRGARFIIVIGENEVSSKQLTIKNLLSGEEHTGELGSLMNYLDVK
ncbi:histidine--tRNA ligase [Candidatus Nomurabacteria bacterium]|nr:histidine--tRNA ligase [Candidatus Kaiserbacteria bacterium]MCB9814163.1 histidine--tRNA ligase [Candidatus Nomurabacteria bacterium]